MCGIIGKISKHKLTNQDSFFMKNALCKLNHRGPDFSDYKKFDNAILGHTRLSIIDIDGGNQPLIDEELSLIIVFNGEIYNYIELKKDLLKEGYSFKTNSDTEVILKSYRQWGTDCLTKFNGMFSFVIYDMTKEEFFAARDRFGEKNLYYYFDNENFIFSSEPKAIFEFDLKPVFNSDMLISYFNFRSFNAPNTVFKNVKKLEAGFYLLLNRDFELKKTQFFDLNTIIINERDYLEYNEEEIIDILIDKLRESIRIRLRSDVPVASFLSGGVDSSIVTALMAEVYGERFSTFSVAVSDARFNETEYQSYVSEKYHTTHKSYNIEKAEYLNFIDKWLFQCDDLVADPSAIALAFLSKLVNDNNIKVVLTGEGADEIFSGYPSYRNYLKIMNYNSYLKPLGVFKNKLNRLSCFFESKKLNFCRLTDDNEFFRGTTNPYQVEQLKKIILIEQNLNCDEFWHGKEKSCLNNLLKFDIKYRLSDDILSRTDKASMMYSIETRAPFLDVNFFNWAFNLPEKYKINNGIDKYILKKAASKYFNEDLIYRNKIGFDLPLDLWLKKDLRNIVLQLISERKLEFIDYDIINKYYNEFLRNNYYSGIIWWWFCLEKHHRIWF